MAITLEDIFYNRVRELPHPAAIPVEGCCIVDLAAELFADIARRLNFRSLMALASTCRDFRVLGRQEFLRNLDIVSKLVARQFSRPIPRPLPFSEEPFQAPLCLSLPSVRSATTIKQCPNVVSLQVLDAQTAPEHLEELFKGALKLVQADFRHFMRIPDDRLAAMPFPATLRDVQLIGANIGTKTVRAIATTCQGLEKLSIHSSGPIDFRVFSATTPLVHLRSLEFFQVAIQEQDFSHLLASCPNVNRIFIRTSPGFTGASIASFAGLQFLEELDVSSTEIQGESFVPIIAGAKSLKSLNVSYTALTTQVFCTPVYPSTLKKVRACWTDINDQGVLRILETCKLEERDFSDSLVNNFPLA